MAVIVYALCSITSLLCAVLLLRGYTNTRVPLLLWSGVCFVGLSLSNFLLLLGPRLPDALVDYRALPSLTGTLLLVASLVGESRT